MSHLTRIILVSFILILPVFAANAYNKVFSVMTYNLENLFDTHHDQGKNDYSFLPLYRKRNDPKIMNHCRSIPVPVFRSQCFNLDWNENVLLNKIRNLSEIILTADNGRSPDILILQEVENANALRKLVDEGLHGEGYRELILFEGPDQRGIDVAIISKFKLADDIRYHQIPVKDGYNNPKKARPTRGILEATFKVNRKKIAVLANHWPSQANPNKTRLIAAQTLMKVVEGIKYPTIIAGDFNVENNDRLNPLRDYLLNQSYEHFFMDFEESHYGSGFVSVPISTPRGTHFYRGKWNSLDRIMVPAWHLKGNCRLGRRKCLTPVWSSYAVIRNHRMTETISYYEKGVLKRAKIPQRFNPETGKGASDHFAVLGRFIF